MTFAAMLLGERVLRNPTTGIAGCCACVASGHAAAPPSRAMNVRLLMSGDSSPSAASLPRNGVRFCWQPLNRSDSRSSLRSLRRLLEAARNRLWEFLSLPNCALEVLIHARWHGLVVLIRNVFPSTGSGHRKCGNAIGHGRRCTDATPSFSDRLWDRAF